MRFYLWKLQVQLGLLSNFLVEISTISFSEPQGFVVSSDIAAGIATRYGLKGLGIESRWGRDLPHPSRPILLYYGHHFSLPGAKRPRRGVDHTSYLAPRLTKE